MTFRFLTSLDDVSIARRVTESSNRCVDLLGPQQDFYVNAPDGLFVDLQDEAGVPRRGVASRVDRESPVATTG
jgi:hypothetical protein